MASHPTRHFLGWNAPPLVAAAAWLHARPEIDWGRLIVSVPGRRAGRRLLELLTRAAEPDWTPPRVLTQGQLTDELVMLSRPPASRLVRTLAWERALRELGEKERGRIARRRAGSEALTERLRLAETVRALHGALAPEGLDFEHLARGDARPDSPGEAARWEALAEAQTRYRQLLGEHELADPHEARLQAIEDGRIDRGRRIVLVGVADMNHLLLRSLETVREEVDVLIAAPEELAEGFDEWGRLRTEFWKDREVELPLERWHVVEKPVDQADLVVDVLGGWNGRFSAEEIAIGVADEEVGPYLEQRLSSSDVFVRDAAGVPVERSRPFRLLRAVARYLEGRRFTALAALIRHPDVEPFLRERLGLFGEPVSAMDAYHAEHLPDAADEWVDDAELTPAVRQVHATVGALLDALDQGDTRTAATWAPEIRSFLTRAYGGRGLDPEVEPERQLAEALRLFGEVLAEVEEAPDELLGTRLTSPEVLDLLLRQLHGRRVPPPPPRPDRATIELLGWLELPLDDAPALVVTGFNEGRIPQSVHGDAFLPEAARRRLGLVTNDDRLARDVYATSVLLHTRQAAEFVTGRRSFDGDPLVPSRIAFQSPRGEVVARVSRFLPDETSSRPAGSAPRHGERSAEELPRRAGAATPESMSVSSFGTYLDSPYLFYQRYVARSRTIDDRARELDPLHFGNLAHSVLQTFGESDLRDSADEEAVAEYLALTVDERVRALYGATPLPTVVLQAEQLKYRLAIFAVSQAERASQGWRVAHVEWKPEGGEVPLDVDGNAMPIRGRIDRIDRHAKLGWAIIDYKTSEGGEGPDKAHRKRDGSWKSLQLPLYRHLSRSLGMQDVPALGFCTLGKDESAIGFRWAKDWSEGLVDEGLERARDVVRAVREGRFFEPGSRTPYEPILRALFGDGLILGEGPEDGE